MQETFLQGHILSTSGAALIALWHLHFESFTGRSSEPFCLVELLYKSWGGGVQKYRLETAIMGLNLEW
jgi:hypothetical protein